MSNQSGGSFFGSIVSFVFMAIVGLHVYFWFSYDTIDPCEVAVLHTLEDLLGELPTALLVAADDGEVSVLADEIREEVGFIACYKIAIGGADAIPGVLAKKVKEDRKGE